MTYVRRECDPQWEVKGAINVALVPSKHRQTQVLCRSSPSCSDHQYSRSINIPLSVISSVDTYAWNHPFMASFIYSIPWDPNVYIGFHAANILNLANLVLSNMDKVNILWRLNKELSVYVHLVKHVQQVVLTLDSKANNNSLKTRQGPRRRRVISTVSDLFHEAEEEYLINNTSTISLTGTSSLNYAYFYFYHW